MCWLWGVAVVGTLQHKTEDVGGGMGGEGGGGGVRGCVRCLSGPCHDADTSLSQNFPSALLENGLKREQLH